MSHAELEPLPSVRLERVELATVDLPLATPFHSSGQARDARTVLLVHVVAEEAEGWAECVAEAAPSYAAEFVGAAEIVLRDHLAPLLDPCEDALGLHDRLQRVAGHEMAKAALELALLDAQLRAAGRSLAGWLGATGSTVPAGAAVGLHDDLDDLLAELDAAMAAGAARVRMKIRPGRGATAVRAAREHLGAGVPLQADANGGFRLGDRDHLAELRRIDELGLVCLEQPLVADDLLGHAELARELDTPICLDESVRSAGALETALQLGACEVLCLKPGPVGGWIAARRLHDRCQEVGLPVWVGGMLETAVGRAANAALAALPGMSLPPDLDPRGRFSPDLADPSPAKAGRIPVPRDDGTGVAPSPGRLLGAELAVVFRCR